MNGEQLKGLLQGLMELGAMSAFMGAVLIWADALMRV